MGRQGRERIARDFSSCRLHGAFRSSFPLARLVIESPCAWRQIFVRTKKYFCAHENLMPSAQCSDAQPAGEDFSP